MGIERFFEMQKALDEVTVNEKQLTSRDLLDEEILALKVELAGCVNEW